jgi:hypothetical protein
VNKNITINSKFSVLPLLGVAFVVLKLLKVITWSWWWITLPFWGGVALVVIGVILYALFTIWLYTRK